MIICLSFKALHYPQSFHKTKFQTSLWNVRKIILYYGSKYGENCDSQLRRIYSLLLKIEKYPEIKKLNRNLR